MGFISGRLCPIKPIPPCKHHFLVPKVESNCHKGERLEIGVLEETLHSTEWCARGQDHGRMA